MRIAYSYLRFSRPEQAKGDSTRRQKDAAELVCERRGLLLKPLRPDKGKSAFRGANFADGPLREFIDMVRAGKIEKGSYLILEKIDRFSRTDVDIAMHYFGEIIRGGVIILTTEPEEEYTLDNLKGMKLLPLVIHFLLANEESEKKSDRLGKAWGQKRKDAIEKQLKLTSMNPRWLRLSKDRLTFTVIDDAVKTIHLIFKLAIEGLGVIRIAKRLNAQHVATFGRAKLWGRSSVMKILKNRAVLGEYQPHQLDYTTGKKRRKVVGEPILNYYPAIVTEDIFYRAQEALKANSSGGKPGKNEFCNLFRGISYDANTKSRLVLINKGGESIGRQLVPSAALIDSEKYWSIPYKMMEKYFLSFVSELSPEDVLPTNDDSVAQGKLASAQGRLAKVEHRIDSLKRQVLNLDDDAPDTIAELLMDLEKKRKAINREIDEARVEASKFQPDHGLADAQEILELLKTADDQEGLRHRLRQAIRSVVTAIWVVSEEVKLDSSRCLAQLHKRASKSDRVTVYHMQIFFGDSHRTITIYRWGRKVVFGIGFGRIADKHLDILPVPDLRKHDGDPIARNLEWITSANLLKTLESGRAYDVMTATA